MHKALGGGGGGGWGDEQGSGGTEQVVEGCTGAHKAAQMLSARGSQGGAKLWKIVQSSYRGLQKAAQMLSKL